MENSWIVLDSDHQHQLLMRAQSATPTASNTPPPPSDFSLQKLENLERGGEGARGLEEDGSDDNEDEDDNEDNDDEDDEEQEAITPKSSSVRLALELAERSFEAIDASPTSSPLGLPSSSSSPLASASNDRYGGRGNPALRDLRGEIARPQSPLAEHRKPAPVRKQDLPSGKGNNDEDEDDDDASSFAFTLMLALSHAVALVVGYYIGTRTLSSYSPSSSHSPSHTHGNGAAGLLSIE